MRENHQEQFQDLALLTSCQMMELRDLVLIRLVIWRIAEMMVSVSSVQLEYVGKTFIAEGLKDVLSAMESLCKYFV